METAYLTPEVARRLEEQLEKLKTVDRLEVAEQIRVARDFGDISENAEYDEAKNAQARIEGQIVELEEKLRNAVIVNKTENDSSVVVIGSKVELADANGHKMSIHLGGSSEANPREKVYTIESPIGAAILGQCVGTTVEVTTPGGIKNFTIISIG